MLIKTEEDIKEVINLKWDQFKVKVKDFSFIIEEQPVPFDAVDDTLVDWDAYEEDFGDEDITDVYSGDVY